MRANIVHSHSLSTIALNYASDAGGVWSKDHMDIFGLLGSGALWPFIGNSSTPSVAAQHINSIFSGAVSPAAGGEQAAILGTGPVRLVPL